MSEQYRALTRKYRPINFEDIVSQEHVSSTLKNAIEQNRLAHAYLFCGPRGVGKTTMARVLARTINKVDADVDGEALSNTLNIVEIDAASNNGVDDVRALRERVRIPPQNGRYKVYIIDEVHMLSKAAFNALLKTLEEPPAHAIFIFATTEPHKVLPTILSRCQRFDFRRIKVDEIVERLKNIAAAEQISIDEESLHVVARKADGALRDALGILDQVIAFCGTDIRHEDVLKALNVVGSDILFELTGAIVAHDSVTGMRLIDRVLLDGHDIQEFLIGLTEHFRNLYFAREADNLSLIEASAEMKARYREVSSSFSEDDLMRLLHITNEAQYKIREAHQPRIQLEVTVLKLIRMERTAGLAELIQEIRTLQGALEGNGAAIPAKSGDSGESPEAAGGNTSAVNSRIQPYEVSAKTGSKGQSGASSMPNIQAKSNSGSGRDDRSDSESGPGSKSETDTKTADQKSVPGSPDSKHVKESSSRPDSGKTSPAQTPSPAPASAAGPATAPASGPASGGDEHNLFGAPSINRTRNRLSAVPRDEVTITARHGQGDHDDDETGIAVSGNLALAAKAMSDIRENTGEQTNSESDKKAGSGAESGQPESNVSPEAAGKTAHTDETELFLHDVKKIWDQYLEVVKTKSTPTVFFAMQNSEPVDLGKGELTLRCPDMFAMNLIQENRIVMQDCLKNVLHRKLRFHCELRQTTADDKVAADPYAKFKQLQQNDPRIKTIVDLFGAELEY
ncbi:MAG: DNA polymerase III subunit gamma/tau [Cyclonatronaceae bacterium]